MVPLIGGGQENTEKPGGNEGTGDGDNSGNESGGETGDNNSDEEKPSSLFQYTIADNGATVTGLTESALSLTDITIPDQLEEKPVIAIGASAFQNNTTVGSIAMPDTITSIESRAFFGCSSLTEITLSNNLKNIGMQAFFRTGIKNITLPASLESMNMLVFASSSVENITFEGSNCTFSESCLQGATNLKTVVLPSQLTSISKALFYQNTNLTTVILPDTVTSIEPHAFRDCSSLTTLTIPNNVTSIDIFAFNGCSNLDLTIPSSVTTIDFGSAFDNTLTFQSVKSLRIPSKWKSSITNCGESKAGAQSLTYL